MCAAAGRANCGHCWAVPGEPCSYTRAAVPGTRLTYPVRGYHPARSGRARRAGLVTADELAALTAGMLPGALVWDNSRTPREVTR
jgi:hypothetical protein